MFLMHCANLPGRAALADAAERLPALANGLLEVQAACPPLLFRTMHDAALTLDRENREQSSTAAVLDSQSIKAPAAEKAWL